MPLYFFNTYDGVEFVDETGTELADDTRAHCEAVRLAGTILQEDPRLLVAGGKLRTEIVSASGELLFTVVACAAAGQPAEAV